MPTHRLESSIEGRVRSEMRKWLAANNLVDEVFYLKFAPAGTIGWPDRLMLWRGGVMFIEYKRPGQRPTSLQQHIHQQLRHLGFEVRVYDDADAALDEIQAAILSTTRAAKGRGANKARGGRTAVSASREGKDRDGAKSVPRAKKRGEGGQAAGPRPAARNNNKLA